jgi:hypothetical protein
MHPELHQTPHALFTGEVSPWRMGDFCVFGCPVFVLDKRLQDGDTLAKWKARCWTCVYVGHSLQYAGNVPLVYNPATTHVSPQYHVTFDDSFATVSGTTATLPKPHHQQLFDSPDWLFKSPFGADDHHLFHEFWTDPPPIVQPPKLARVPIQHSARVPRPSSPPVPRIPHVTDQTHRVVRPTVHHVEYPAGDHAMIQAGDHAVRLIGDHAVIQAGDHAAHPPSDHAMRPTGDHATSRPGDQAQHTVGGLDACLSSVPIRDSPGPNAVACIDVSASAGVPGANPDLPVGFAALPTADLDNCSVSSNGVPYINLRPVACSAALRAYQRASGINAHVYTAHTTRHHSAPPAPIDPLSTALQLDSHLFTYFAEAPLPPAGSISATEGDNKNDILTQGQMLRAPDKDKFVQCQRDEMQSLKDLDIMDVLPMSQLPHKVRLLNSIWSYRRKRLPNGILSKYKSRLRVNGKEQAFGRDYWETYAPVAAWSTI